MASGIKNWCRDCQHCQKAKVTKQPHATVQPIPSTWPLFLPHTHRPCQPLTSLRRRPFSPLHHCGPVNSLGRGHSQCTSTTSCADALISGGISRFSFSDMLTSDRDAQFTSTIWAILTTRLGIHHITTTAYHPQALASAPSLGPPGPPSSPQRRLWPLFVRTSLWCSYQPSWGDAVHVRVTPTQLCAESPHSSPATANKTTVLCRGGQAAAIYSLRGPLHACPQRGHWLRILCPIPRVTR